MPMTTQEKTSTLGKVISLTRVFLVASIAIGGLSVISSAIIFFISGGNEGSGNTNTPVACNYTINSLPYTLGSSGKTYCLGGDIAGNGNFTFSADNVTLDGQSHKVTGSNSITLTDRRGVVIKNLTIPGGISLGGGGHNQVINSHFNYLGVSSDDNLFQDNFIYTPADAFAAIQLKGTDLNYVEGNSFIHNSIAQTGLTTPAPTSDSRYIQLFFARNNVFDNNPVKFVGTGNAIQVHYSFFNTFKNNTFNVTYPSFNDGSERYGWYVRDGSSYNTFIGNTEKTNEYAARFNGPGNETLPWGHDNLIKNNYFSGGSGGPPGATRGIVLHDTTTGNDVFDHNTIYASNSASDGGALIIGVGDNTTTTTVTNNTVVALHGRALLIDGKGRLNVRNNIFYSYDAPAMYFNDNGLGTYLGDYNNFWRVGSTTPITYWASCCGASSMPITTFIARTGQDVHSTGVDPLFDGGSYNLSDGSPAIDRGDPVSPPPPVGGSRIDMGKFEFPKDTSQDTTPPTLSLVLPSDNSHSSPAGRYLCSTCLIAGRADDNGDLQKVEVQIDGQWYAALGTYSWGLSLRNVTLANLASHTLIVKATDTFGQTTTLPTLSFVVDDTLPTGSISTPAETTMTGDATMTATASDNIGIASVQFHVDDNQSGFVSTAAPYSAVFNSALYCNGHHRLNTTVTDTAGNTFLTPTVLIITSNTGKSTCAGG